MTTAGAQTHRAHDQRREEAITRLIAAAPVRREVEGGKMTSYDVTVTREDTLWVAHADNVGATDVEHFQDLEVEVRDYIAGMTDHQLLSCQPQLLPASTRGR
jgi:hypothetical protein